MATITITPASGSITAAKTACVVHVDGADQNTATGYTTGAYPQSPEMRYYLTFEKPASTILGKSYVFGVDENGDHDFMTYVFPSSGSWTIRLSNNADNSSIATASVTVS